MKEVMQTQTPAARDAQKKISDKQLIEEFFAVTDNQWAIDTVRVIRGFLQRFAVRFAAAIAVALL